MPWRLSIINSSTANGGFLEGVAGQNKKPTSPASTNGMIWAAITLYVVPQLQGSRPNWRFAQIRPVTSGCGRLSHPAPQAELRTNAS